MRIHDISISISQDMPTYPGDPMVSLTPKSEIARGDNANVSQLCMGDHTGTHLDPPIHFIPGGKTVDELDLEILYGRALVVDMTKVAKAITPQDLAHAYIPRDITRVLFKTRNSQFWDPPRAFQPDFVGIGWDAADWLVQHGFRLVGIDYLSVELYDAPEPKTHRMLLGADIVVVEGLNLSNVAPGEYTLACLPIKIKGGDGAPCRAILIED